jgi:IclR family transcriptional regulator, acetate operon repressor
MGTVSKALGLLDIIARSNAPKGLTAIANAAGFDKATTRRLLMELTHNGYVVQDSDSRDYELGPALQVLGKAREERFPLYRTTLPFVRALAERTDETVHATEYSAGVLLSICIEHSTKASRVSLEQGQKLPLHATASGIAFLAASTPAFIDGIARKPLAHFTSTTLTSRESLLRVVRETAARGYSISNQSLEEGVSSVAAAIRNQNGKPVGTIAIAVPTLRMTAKVIAELGILAREAADEVSVHLSGRKPSLRKAS